MGRTRCTSAGGAPVTASTSGGDGLSAETRRSAMSASAIGWRRSRFTRTILGMRVPGATVARLFACGLAGAALACREAPRASPRPADAGTLVTVYVPPKAADRLAARLQAVAARRQWALSIRTDSAALTDGRPAPAATEPAERPDAGAVERQLRDGVARFLALAHELLPARRNDLFVRHPAFGDLTLPEWLQFHIRHCAHHAKQIRARLGS